MSDDALPITDRQRSRLLDFVECVDHTYSDGTFQRDKPLVDELLLALALQASVRLGLQEDEIAEFFEREFDLAGMTGGPIGTALALGMLVDAEHRLRARAGGKN
jgi:hypothetical protein